jgi:hypothetical protein
VTVERTFYEFIMLDASDFVKKLRYYKSFKHLKYSLYNSNIAYHNFAYTITMFFTTYCIFS